MEGTEKEILSMKEMLLEMKKSMERMAEELMERMAEELMENHSYKKRDESGTSDGSIMKLKGKKGK